MATYYLNCDSTTDVISWVTDRLPGVGSTDHRLVTNLASGSDTDISWQPRDTSAGGTIKVLSIDSVTDDVSWTA